MNPVEQRQLLADVEAFCAEIRPIEELCYVEHKFNDQVIKRVPFRRWGEPEDFGGIAVYLASDASSFHTGDSFLIDGGYAIF